MSGASKRYRLLGPGGSYESNQRGALGGHSKQKVYGRLDCPVAAALNGRDSAYNLLTLERLAEQRGAEFPDRVEEWTSYLYFLRDYAAPDGSVPAQFNGLITETFADLLPSL